MKISDLSLRELQQARTATEDQLVYEALNIVILANIGVVDDERLRVQAKHAMLRVINEENPE